jgi:hypothetical protein
MMMMAKTRSPEEKREERRSMFRMFSWCCAGPAIRSDNERLLLIQFLKADSSRSSLASYGDRKIKLEQSTSE